jgi:thiamine kinase-like enzyme
MSGPGSGQPLSPLERAARLACWSDSVAPEPLGGGITNTNFVVAHRGERFVVRIGDDIPVHGVMRFNELAAARAAAAAGLSPAIVHAEPGALVMRHIDGRTLTEADVRDQPTLERILPVVRRCHVEMPRHVRGPVLMFWVFHVCRDYVATLREGGSRLGRDLPRLLALNDELEEAVGPIRPVFGHNDLLPGNFIDDGARIWLIDWDYAGFNSCLFDLGGLASNNGLSPEQEDWMLATYFGAAPDAALRRSYLAMKCASLLRETLWSAVSEIHSTLDFDYFAYTASNMDRLEAALDVYRRL